MESIITTILPFVPQAAIPVIICFCFLVYIQSKRKETKIERDSDSQKIHDDILKLQFETTNLKGEVSQQKNINDDLNKQVVELSKAVAQFSIAADTLTESVKELKEDIRDMRNNKK